MIPAPKISNSAITRWEDDGGHGVPQVTASDGLQIELKRYGILAVPLMVFDWGGYRYSNARDAIAAAKRCTRPA